MRLTNGGSIREELNEIPTRNWWKYGFLIPPVLFIALGVIDLFMSGPKLNIFLLIGSGLLLNHLSASFLKKRSHIRIAGFSGVVIWLIFFYTQFFSLI